MYATPYDKHFYYFLTDNSGKVCTLCLLALNLVALTRLQNGVTDNLISVAYLT